MHDSECGRVRTVMYMYKRTECFSSLRAIFKSFTFLAFHFNLHFFHPPPATLEKIDRGVTRRLNTGAMDSINYKTRAPGGGREIRCGICGFSFDL